MKIRKLPEYLFNKIDELIDEDCSGMTLEEEKELLEYVKETLAKIDMVDYVENWMEINKEIREEESVKKRRLRNHHNT
jgi:hypothetical protein